MNTDLKTLLGAVRPLDAAAMAAARARQQRLAKPPHSLGRLEDLSVQLAGITGELGKPLKKRRLLVFAADNGVCREGVASAPREVTLRQTVNLARGVTGAAVLARHFGAELDVTDVGIDADFACDGVRDAKIARGTQNFAEAPAMTREQALAAIRAGADAAERAANDGVDIVGVGEMGIGNTTTAAAVLSALTGLPAEKTAGRGAGIDDEALARKRALIDAAIARWNVDPNDPVDALCKVGGFDVAAMCGAFIGAAARRLPVVIDGFISAVAALCAARLEPLCAATMIPSHASLEPGYALAMDAMGLEPVLRLDMRLGEGSGCPIMFAIADAAQSVIREMATFGEAGIDDGYLADIRANRAFQGEA